MRAITLTEGNKRQVKEMIRQLSTDLGEASSVSEAMLRQELEGNNVFVVEGNGTMDSHKSITTKSLVAPEKVHQLLEPRFETPLGTSAGPWRLQGPEMTR